MNYCNCLHCSEQFEERPVSKRVKLLNLPANRFCSKSCNAKYHHIQRKINTKELSIYTCTNCGCDMVKSQKFCSKSCSAKHNNALRKINGFVGSKHKTKVLHCHDCGSTYEFPVNRSNHFICKNCKPKKLNNCKVCDIEFVYQRGSGRKSVCSEICKTILRKQISRKGGLAASKVNNKRSKNEMLFAEKCLVLDPDLITNEPMFNGWDADVILPRYKIAVLWNGAWHHKKITKSHSLKQVQNRDRIKLKEIVSFGYTPYIIDDHGSENSKFVDEEFIKFKTWMQGEESNFHKAETVSWL